MKRGGELKRYTPLASAIPLPRSHLSANQGGHHKPKPKRRRDTGPSDKTVVQIAERDEWACFRCGGSCHGRRGIDWSVQHRRARGMGGTRREDTNGPQALILLCGSATTGCHGWVESNRTAAMSKGWAVKSNADPLHVPALHWQYGLIFLRADGSMSSRPPRYRPGGMTMRVFEAQAAVEAAALRSIAAHHYARETDPDADAEDGYAGEQLALAARDLVHAVEALPTEKRPVGWDTVEAGVR